MKHDVTTYVDLKKCVQSFKDGVWNVMLVIGRPGQSKSTIVQKTLNPIVELKFEPGIKVGGTRPVLIDGGAMSAFKLYQYLYSYSDHDFVFDDTDSLYSDRQAVRLLKAMCEDRDVKRVAWHTHNIHLDAATIPNQFSTNSKALIILNDWKTLNAQVEALEDRGLVVFFKPNVDEVLNYAKPWFNDKEIVTFVQAHKMFIEHLSLREMNNAKKMRDSNIGNWRATLKKSLGIDKLLMVADLVADQTKLNDDERIREFHKMSGASPKLSHSRDLWFTLKNKLKAIQENQLNQQERGKKKSNISSG